MNDFIAKLEAALEADENSIKAQDEFRELDDWSSLAVLSVGAMLNDEYDLTIPKGDFDALFTVEDLFNYIKDNKI